MKSRIASALAVLACVAALSACSGKGHSSSGGTAPAGEVASTAPGSSAPVPAASTTSAAPSTASHSVAADPDGDLSSLDQQLSAVDGALGSAEPTHTADDNG